MAHKPKLSEDSKPWYSASASERGAYHSTSMATSTPLKRQEPWPLQILSRQMKEVMGNLRPYSSEKPISLHSGTPSISVARNGESSSCREAPVWHVDPISQVESGDAFRAVQEGVEVQVCVSRRQGTCRRRSRWRTHVLQERHVPLIGLDAHRTILLRAPDRVCYASGAYRSRAFSPQRI